MSLSLATLTNLAHACAPQVAAGTLLALAGAESAFDPLAIGVNARPRRREHAVSVADAVARVELHAARGENVDLGLTQLNIRTLPHLGLAVADAFDPCRNLAGGARVLAAAYRAAHATAPGDQPALDAALSRYNTGDPRRGLRNGYVARVRSMAARLARVPEAAGGRELAASPTAPAPPPPVVLQRAETTAAAARALDVFADPSLRAVVWRPPASDDATRPSPSPPNQGVLP